MFSSDIAYIIICGNKEVENVIGGLVLHIVIPATGRNAHEFLCEKFPCFAIYLYDGHWSSVIVNVYRDGYATFWRLCVYCTVFSMSY